MIIRFKIESNAAILEFKDYPNPELNKDIEVICKKLSSTKNITAVYFSAVRRYGESPDFQHALNRIITITSIKELFFETILSGCLDNIVNIIKHAKQEKISFFDCDIDRKSDFSLLKECIKNNKNIKEVRMINVLVSGAADLDDFKQFCKEQKVQLEIITLPSPQFIPPTELKM